jgi:hypothetical protein
MELLLVCRLQRYKNTSSMERIKLIEFYKSEVGHVIYSYRTESIEQLIEHIKSVFRIDPILVR